jgi:autotransporter-associated beta strand protein
VGLTNTKTYLNVVDAGGWGGIVNGVTFARGNFNSNPSGSNYAVTGAGSTSYRDPINLGGELGKIVLDFVYGGTQTLTLSGLTAGETYTTSFYNYAWDSSSTDRKQNITTTSGASATFSQNFNGYNNANILRYSFVAAGTTEAITFSPQTSATFHNSAFSTEQVFNKSYVGGTQWTSASWSTAGAPNAVGANADFTAQAAPTTLNLNASQTVGNLRFAGTNSWTIAGSNTLTLQADIGGRAILSATSGTHTITAPTLWNSDLWVSGAGTLELAGSVGSTSSSLTKTGSGVLTLSGSNAYSGESFINAGMLVAANNNALGAGGLSSTTKTTVSTGATLALQGNISLDEHMHIFGSGVGGLGAIRNLSGSNSLTSAGYALRTLDATIGADAGRLTISGGLYQEGGTYGLTKVGAGTVVLSGANSYGSETVISAGTLVAANNSALGTGGFNATTKATIYNGATLALQGNISSDEHLHVYGSGVGGQGALRNLSGNNTLTTTGHALRSDVTLGADAGQLTINGSLYEEGGTYGVTKVGAGTVVLAGANTYAGGTTINGGTLALSGNNRLATNGSVTVQSGGTLRLGGDQTLASLAGSGAVTFASNSTGYYLKVGSQSSTFDGVISGMGYLQKEGAGTLTLTGKNTYTATTLVMGGTLATIGANVLPNGNITVNAGGTLLLGGNQEVTSVSGTGIVNLNGYTLKMGGGSSMFSGEATGGGILQKDGFGTWSVSGTTTGTTAVLLNGGTIKLMGHDRLSDAGAVTVNNGTFDMNGYNDVAGSVTINGGKIINGTLRAATVAMDNGSVSGVLTGTGGFTKTGGGLVTISSTNTYTGVTAVQGGTLATTGANQLAAGGSVEVGSGGTFKMGGNQTLASVTGAGGINLGNGTLTTGSNSSTFAGTISGNGGLTKTGPGTLTLSGSNSFTGDTVISGGTLVLASSNALASDAVISMGSGSTLQLSGRTVVGAIDQGAGTITGGTLVSSLVATTSGALNSSIADGEGFAAGILKRGGGTTTIGAANTFTGSIKLQGGTLVLDGAGSFDAASRLVMSDGATMDLNGKSQTFSGLSGNGGTVALGSGQLTVSNNTSGLFSGAITGTGSLAKSGNGVMELTGTNGYTGTTMVSGGTLIVAAGGSIASSSIATVGADAHLKVNGAAGAVSVSGTLSGSGTVGAVTLSSGGTLAVGNSPGLLTAASANWNVGSGFQFEIIDALGTAGTDWDLFSVTGQLNLGGISAGNKMLLTILSTDLQNYDVESEYSWVFAQAASFAGTESWASGLDVTDRFAITSNGFNGGTQPGGGFTVVTGTSEGGLATLSIKAVPEPSSVSLLVVGIGGLLAFRRRRKQTD